MAQLPAIRDSADAEPVEAAHWPREARNFAIPLAGMGLFGWILNVGDRYILAYSVSMDDVGRYAAVYGLIAAPMAALVMMTSRFLKSSKSTDFLCPIAALIWISTPLFTRIQRASRYCVRIAGVTRTLIMRSTKKWRGM